MLSIEFLKTKPHEATELDKRAIDNLRPYLANRAQRGDLNADTLEILDESNYITVSVAKIYEESGISPEITLEETYSGKERAAALKRFEKLKKQYPSIEHIKEIDKYKWER